MDCEAIGNFQGIRRDFVSYVLLMPAVVARTFVSAGIAQGQYGTARRWHGLFSLLPTRHRWASLTKPSSSMHSDMVRQFSVCRSTCRNACQHFICMAKQVSNVFVAAHRTARPSRTGPTWESSPW